MRTATPVTTTTWHPHFNRRIPGIWLLAVLCLCLAMPAAHAAAGKRVALVLGNAAYQGEKPLVNPGNDAADMAALLGRMGFNGGKVQPLVNLGRKAMNAAVQDFLNQAEGAELAVVYYSGHGMQANGESFLIPVDAQIQSERDVRSEGIRLGELMEDLESRRIRHTLLVLDACRDNPYRTRTKSTSKGLAPPREMNGAYLVAYATAEGKTADDGTGRNGTYTSELLRHLGKPGISLRDAVEDTQLAVEDTTRGQQRPKIYGDSARFRKVYLSDATPVVTPPSPGQAFKDCADCPEMVVIPAGSFVMGSGVEEQKKAQEAGASKEWTDREIPQRRVSVGSFAAGIYAVTKGQFAAFVQAKGYRTEAERGDGCFAWTGSEWKHEAQRNWRNPGFAQSDDHPFGLYNVHGNVWEWVQDCFEDNYSQGQPTDGSAHRGNDSSCSRRVLRGGSWDNDPDNLRLANRNWNTPDFRNFNLGFRIARTVS